MKVQATLPKGMASPRNSVNPIARWSGPGQTQAEAMDFDTQLDRSRRFGHDFTRLQPGPEVSSLPNQRSAPGTEHAAPASGPATEPIQCWPDEDDKDLISRGLAYGGVAGTGMLIRHNVHKYGGSKASGYERGMLGLIQNFKHFQKAPGPIKAASLIGIGGGMALSAGTEFMPRLMKKIFGKKDE